MKTITFLPAAAFVIIAATFSFNTDDRSYAPRFSKEVQREEAGGAVKYMFDMRKNVLTGQLDYEAMARGQEEVMRNSAASKNKNGQVQSATLNWKELGPGNVGGRTRGFLIDKNNPSKLYSGGVGGGLWISNDKGATWNKWSGSDQLSNMAVTCIAQAPNGDILFGTGEGLYVQYGFGAGGLIGGGMWRSTDGGNTFNVIPSTVPVSVFTSTAWASINAIAVDPFNSSRIYAATNTGLRLTLNGGATWMHPVRFTNGNANTTPTTDVEVGSDGVVFAAVGSKCYKSLTGDSASFVSVSTGGTALPTAASGRLEIAISPTDPNFVYATTTSAGGLYGVYQSVDKGVTWKVIGPGGSSTFSPFGTAPNLQADYDNALAVNPSNKGEIILGGVELWRWRQNTSTSYGQGQWSQIATEFGFSGMQYYVHSDKHIIAFDKTNTNTCYIGCDGGVFRSLNMNSPVPTYSACNSGYCVTQLYSVAFEPDNVSPMGSGVIGGTQDNGTQYLNGYPNGSNNMWAVSVGGGDGGEVEISQLNPNAFFTTVYYGSLARSSNKGNSSASFYSAKINALFPTLGDPGFASFVTPISLYESANSLNSKDSVLWVADQNYAQNTIVGVQSRTNSQWFGYQLPTAVNQGDTLKVQDRVVSRIVVGFNGSSGVWMTKKAIDFSVTPAWLRIAGSAKAGRQISGNVESFAWSADGDHLFIGTSGGFLYRISNMSAAIDSLTGDIGDNATLNASCLTTQTTCGTFGGRYVTGISVDPGNPDNVAVSVANYGATDYVYYSTNATSATPSFTAKTGTTLNTNKLPAVPAYGIIIEKSNPKRVIVATEWGVYKTEDITQPASAIVWTRENANGMANTAAFAIRQQRLEPWHTVSFGGNTTKVTNSGKIYVGTHGRGIFECDNYYTSSLSSVAEGGSLGTGLSIYPNPSAGEANISFGLEKACDVNVAVYDLQGRLVSSRKLQGLPGQNRAKLDISTFANGTYLLNLEAEGLRSSTKFVVLGQ